MERFAKKDNEFIRKLQLFLQYQLFMFSILWNKYREFFNTRRVFTLEIQASLSYGTIIRTEITCKKISLKSIEFGMALK